MKMEKRPDMRKRCMRRFIGCAVVSATSAAVAPAWAEGWRLTTAMTTRLIASDNINYSAVNKSSDTLVELNPSFRVTRRSARLQLNAAYTPRYFYYADDTFDSRLAHDYNVTGRLEVIDDLFFLDARAVSAQRNQSVFNAVPTDTQSAANQLSRTRTYSITPSFRGRIRLGDVATWSSSFTAIRSESSGLQSDSLSTETFTGTLAGMPAKVGWQVDVSSISTTSDIARSTDRKRIIGSLIYRPEATVKLVGRYGYEDTNFGNQRSGDTWGAGLTWSPSPRTSFSGDYDDRPYGSTFALNAQHRLPLVSLSSTYTRNLTNRAEQLLQPNGVFDRFDLLILRPEIAGETDPVERERLLNAALNGQDRFVTVLSPLLSDRQFLQTRWQVSATRTGARNSISLSFFRTESDSGVGSNGPAIGDDFALSSVILQRGWTASYSHRLTPASSLNLSLTSSKSNGRAGTGFGANRDLLNATWSTRLGTRSNGSIGFRMTRATVVSGDVDENAVIATLTTQFN
jgi:uncharacterized protein (PEP-CTERM system associated)